MFDGEALGRQVVVVVRDFVARALEPQQARIVQLEQRLAALEAAPFEYVGTFAVGRTYTKNQFVTHDGSLWHANSTTTARPGDGSGGWTLAVKKGQAAK